MALAVNNSVKECKMDSDWAAIIGAGVGAIGKLGTAWLNAFLARKRPDPADVAAKKQLFDMLSAKGFKWYILRRLSYVIGQPEDATRKLLLGIGARGSERNPELWGLVSRNPLPSHGGFPDPTLPY